MYSFTLSPKIICINAPLYVSDFPNICSASHGIQPKNYARYCSGKLSRSTTRAAFSDPFVLQIAETLEDSVSSPSILPSPPPPPLQKLRDISSESLLSVSWPSRKDEEFRFTDISSLRSAQIYPTVNLSTDSDLTGISKNEEFPNLVIVDGHIEKSLSNLPMLPDGAFVGSLVDLSSETALQRVNEFVSNFKGDLFWSLNGVGTPELSIIYVPEGCKVETPIYLRYYAVEGSDAELNKLPVSNPRVLVVVEKGGEVGFIEEFSAIDEDMCYWANSVLEIVIGEGAMVNHSYVQSQSLEATHIKWTSVRQETASTYKLVEVSAGGKLSRHNLHVQQVGPETTTELSTLHLSIDDQTQDLHSKLVLDHPRGVSRQLHKCIVAHPQGHAVFDGNVRVNRYAQQTDAGQLTRSLLLVPRATVNVKPNLQIIADDVKCSHGAAISDLEENQLFYFQSRGISLEMARKALIYSFGAEVIERFPNKFVRDKTKNLIGALLIPTMETSTSE